MDQLFELICKKFPHLFVIKDEMQNTISAVNPHSDKQMQIVVLPFGTIELTIEDCKERFNSVREITTFINQN